MTQSNMNMADRLAAKIKNSELGALIGEEDIYDLAKQAIERAFFQERENPDRYNSKRLPPLVVEMATEQFKEVLREKIRPVVDEIVRNAAFTQMVLEAVALNIPKAAESAAQQIMYGAVQTGTDQYNRDLPEQLRRVVEAALRS